ncbi:hypothetical protein Pla111_01900 [Botrimarina hoheduenensis]|uniref:Uncharacterized protein n=2 Tax=Botrimarina hoheduenensis TaxID=2528000 RepID=A0A5C5WF79_9BACT|nr:hypothetical protein Pla111_01900 [Botrimarina hoheduenensis]
MLCASVTAADDRPTGDSSSSALQAAQQTIPWQALSAAQQQAVAEVVNDSTLFRRLPTRVIDCDAELFDHLAEHPELVVETWNLMGVSQVGLRRTGPNNYSATDAAGGQGSIQILDRRQEANGVTHVLAYARGIYRAPPMPASLTATTVMVMRSHPHREANGRTHITTEMDAFIRLDRPAAELVMRTLKPLVTRTADHNFVETMRFVSLFSRTAEQNPEGMQRLAEQLTEVDDATRARFIAVCHRTAQRSLARRDERLRLASTGQ